MSDINPEIKLHRARRQIDAYVERYNALLKSNVADSSIADDYISYLGGVIVGLQKARLTISTTEENNELQTALTKMGF
jgi:hypothetical protein